MHAPVQSESFDQSISDKKRQANRANAQKSTGPKTPEGKSSSAQNALRHGGFSQDTLLPSENPKPFYHFRRAWLQDFSPQTCSELFLTERAVSLAWRLHRLTQADTGLHFNALCNFETSIEKFHKKNPSEEAPTILLPPAMALTDAFESDSKPNPFDRLSKTEDRLQSMLHRIIKQLQSLQKQRKDNPPPPCPFLPEEDPDESDFEESEEIPQNEATEDTTEIDPDEEQIEKAQNQPTENQPPTPMPTTTAVACVVADEKAQIEPTTCAIHPLSGANPTS